ncbi:MAG: hypothetical protein WDM78_16930 [Puia sp.]
MQMAVIEFARNILGLTKAHSTEMQADTPTPVIDLMEHQKKITVKGRNDAPGRISLRSRKRDAGESHIWQNDDL